jgi:hypothetical protein
VIFTARYLEPWYGYDFDGTLAYWPPDGADDVSVAYVGEPLWPTIERVKQRIAAGQNVKIFTARVWTDGTPERERDVMIARSVISAFCLEYIGRILPITCEKDPACIEIEDDRARQIERNTGRRGINSEW